MRALGSGSRKKEGLRKEEKKNVACCFFSVCATGLFTGEGHRDAQWEVGKTDWERKRGDRRRQDKGG